MRIILALIGVRRLEVLVVALIIALDDVLAAVWVGGLVLIGVRVPVAVIAV